MIHTSFFMYVTVAFIGAGLTVALFLSGRPRPWYGYPRERSIIGTSVKSGLATAILLTLAVVTHGHSALVRNAASAHMSVTHILVYGFGATFTVVTVAVLIFLAGRNL
jgi:hypothetical protein